MTRPATSQSLIAWLLGDVQSTQGQTWSPAHRFSFRVLLLFMLIGEYELIREVLTLGSYTSPPAPDPDGLTIWFGDAIFGVDLSAARPRTSDSKLYAWVYKGTYLALSTLIAAVWSLIDRRSRAYSVLWDGLWTLMRMIVGLYMMTYGFAKIFGVQFTIPSSTVLMSEVGSLSPSALMKVFMGTSQTYSAIAGWVEVIGGIMLCFRRSTLIGALITLGMLINIFAMNVFYNFGMQRLALELTLLTLLILAPYMRSLVTLIVLHKTATPVELYGPWTTLKWRRIGVAVMTLWCIASLWIRGSEFYQFAYDYGELGPRGALDGTWSVTSMSRDGEHIPPTLGSKDRWRSVTFYQRPQWAEATIGTLDSAHTKYRLIVKEDHIMLKEMSFEEELDQIKLIGDLTYKSLSAEGDKNARVIMVRGQVSGSEIQATLRFTPQASFKLLNGYVGLIRP